MAGGLNGPLVAVYGRGKNMDTARTLAKEIHDFLYKYDPAFGYPTGLEGCQNEEEWIETIEGDIKEGRDFSTWLEVDNASPEVAAIADDLCSRISALNLEPAPAKETYDVYLTTYEDGGYDFIAASFDDRYDAESFYVLLRNEGYYVSKVEVTWDNKGTQDVMRIPVMTFLEEAQKNEKIVAAVEEFKRGMENEPPREPQHKDTSFSEPEDGVSADSRHDTYEVYLAADGDFDVVGVAFAGGFEKQQDAEAFSILLKDEGFIVTDVQRHIYDGKNHHISDVTVTSTLESARLNENAVSALNDVKRGKYLGDSASYIKMERSSMEDRMAAAKLAADVRNAGKPVSKLEKTKMEAI
jgi:hypothetical protein